MRACAIGFVCTDVYEEQGISYPTGNGVDFVINLQRLGIPGSVVSAVGDDEYGRAMRETLEARGIDISRLRVMEGTTAVIKMRLAGRDRVHGERIRGVMDAYRPSPEDVAFAKKHDLIHVDLSARIPELLPELRSEGARIFFDFSIRHRLPGNEEILANVDYAMFSFEKYDDSIKDTLIWARSFGARVAIGTFGVEGSMAYDGTDFTRCGIVEAEVVNTVGAGDSFAAGFMYEAMKGSDISTCLNSGARLAAQIVSRFEPY
jgi:fructoselysine 6-kinase